ncbi:MAG: pyridoxal-phosphate dependent enzyme [Dehalococcoidia bacterium]|nr:pyridoxal-phosphate dependent enzyme [Dehalococcoidia bacterium]
MIPLLEQHPALINTLPHIALGEFPTPVQKLDKLGHQIGLDHLYIKRDDLSGKTYGGNKVRKLEFLLGDALHSGAKEVLTFGAAGSNHALATAVYAQQLGLRSISMLRPQPNAHSVRRNLLMSYHCGADLHLCSPILCDTPLAVLSASYQRLRHRLRSGQFPRVIPMGGSSPLGVLGFVNAALEFKDQVARGEIPEPDYIYVASGSMGTAAGLILGLKAANSKTRVIAVRVTGEKFVNKTGMIELIRKTNSLLCSLASSFPSMDFTEDDVEIRHDFFGESYALYTAEGMQASDRIERAEGIKLEGTYTAKALAALLDNAERQALQNKVVLFWNTYNSRDFSDAIAGIDYHQLPRCFHRYFEEEVQPLDRRE